MRAHRLVRPCAVAFLFSAFEFIRSESAKFARIIVEDGVKLEQ